MVRWLRGVGELLARGATVITLAVVSLTLGIVASGRPPADTDADPPWFVGGLFAVSALTVLLLHILRLIDAARERAALQLQLDQLQEQLTRIEAAVAAVASPRRQERRRGCRAMSAAALIGAALARRLAR